MEKPLRKKPEGEGREGRGEKREWKNPSGKNQRGRGESLLWKNQMVFGQDFGGSGS